MNILLIDSKTNKKHFQSQNCKKKAIHFNTMHLVNSNSVNYNSDCRLVRWPRLSSAHPLPLIPLPHQTGGICKESVYTCIRHYRGKTSNEKVCVSRSGFFLLFSWEKSRMSSQFFFRWRRGRGRRGTLSIYAIHLF